MATTTNFRTKPEGMGGNPETSHTSGNYTLPYDDPAMINPDELASFPKQANPEAHHLYDHESHLVNRRTPVRDGRNITRTDNQPDRHGFM